MLKSYIQTRIVNAKPEDHAGESGFRVVYPGGYAEWVSEETFYQTHREILRHEVQIMAMTSEEASIAAISDGDPDEKFCPRNKDGVHLWADNLSQDIRTCEYCHREKPL